MIVVNKYFFNLNICKKNYILNLIVKISYSELVLLNSKKKY